MSNLTVTERNNVLVVDSRLVAAQLGIQHKNFLVTVEKYNSKMASALEIGPAAFETRLVKRLQGGTYEERWAWLTETQATFIMTLSRNTEQVVNCKLALVIAFEKAKQIIKEVVPAQSARIRELELELQVAQAQAAAAQSQERLMQATNAIAALHGSRMVELVLGKPDAIVTCTEVIEKTIAVDAKTGRVLAQSDGMTIGYLTKRLGFKNNEQTWQWLNSVQLGKDSGAWTKELTAHPTLKRVQREKVGSSGIKPSR